MRNGVERDQQAQHVTEKLTRGTRREMLVPVYSRQTT
jgi:hypothetical protein